MGNHMACLSPPPALKRLQTPYSSDCTIKFLHCDTGAVSELDAPLTAAEAMIEFPTQFLCSLSHAASSTSCGRRISAVPADAELQGAHELYLLLPMHRLNSRFSVEEMAFFAALKAAQTFNYKGKLGAKGTISQSRVVPSLCDFTQGSSISTDSSNYNTSVVMMRSLSLKPLIMDQATKLQQMNEGPASAFITSTQGTVNHNIALCRSKSWMPKLETVQEYAVAS